ncbi:hypothetical protein IPG36_00120 [bacterium]|nr:MAG: hypothetical protein IPG36_00120 [bacterium]
MGIFSKKIILRRFLEMVQRAFKEYLRLETNQDKLVSQLAKQLGKTDPLLSFLIGPFEDNKRELFISCDGVRRDMPRVHAIVAVAPKIPGWKITAFKPAIEIETAQYEGLEMAASDVYFSSRPVEDGYLDLVVFMKGTRPRSRADTWA